MGQFEAAMNAFEHAFKSGQFVMQSAYARGLCQKKLGLSVEIPTELGDSAEDAGTVYVASNLACHLISKGHRAALTKQGSTSEVTALMDGSLYVISISSLFGDFNTWVWRKEGGKSISVPDPGANPNPTRTDKFVISLAQRAGVMPPEPMPESEDWVQGAIDHGLEEACWHSQHESSTETSQGADAVGAAPLDDENIVIVTSPMVGTFYARLSPDADPFVKVGDHVEADTTICIIEALRVRNEINLEMCGQAVSGQVVAILARNAEPVEYGGPLFKLDIAEKDQKASGDQEHEHQTGR